MSESTAVVTQDELQFFRSLEATPSYDKTQPSLLETDPRLLPGDLINYAAGVIMAAETLIAHHHGLPPVSGNVCRRFFHIPKSSETPPPRYTINDLLTKPHLTKPPLVLEPDLGELPTSEFVITAEQHLRGFAEALQEQPEIDETSLENQIIYSSRNIDPTKAALLTESSQTTRDPLALSIRALLRLQQQYSEVYRDRGQYDHEGFFNLPDKITTTSRNPRTDIVTKNTLRIRAGDKFRLNRASYEVWLAKRPKQD